jgi:hypothetical protein
MTWGGYLASRRFNAVEGTGGRRRKHPQTIKKIIDACAAVHHTQT